MKINLSGHELNINRWVAAAVITAAILALGFAGYTLSRDNNMIIFEGGDDGTGYVGTGYAGTGHAAGYAEANASTVASEEPGVTCADMTGSLTEPLKDPLKEPIIKIYIIGCVNKPGIVTIQKGQLICDAIDAAGGATPDADLENINLVYTLEENLMLKILSKKETKTVSQANGAPSGYPGTGKGVLILKDEGKGAGMTSSGGSAKAPAININSASAQELDTLPGIGPATASDIISFRNKHGPFARIEDIMKVSGIKQSRFQKIKDFITVQ